MKKLYFIFFLIIIVACSKDPYNYTLDEIYEDYYKQKIVEKRLSLKERFLIDMAENRYEQLGKLDELRKKTLKEIINEQENLTNLDKFSKNIKIQIIARKIIKSKDKTFLIWKLKILNKLKSDIDKLQGWLIFTDNKTREILRIDTINCEKIIKNNTFIEFQTHYHDYNQKIKADNKLLNLDIKEINKIFDFNPTLIQLSNGITITNTTN